MLVARYCNNVGCSPEQKVGVEVSTAQRRDAAEVAHSPRFVGDGSEGESCV